MGELTVGHGELCSRRRSAVAAARLGKPSGLHAGPTSWSFIRPLHPHTWRMVHAQAVEYDFQYYALPQPADAPVTVLSCGRSLFRDAIDVEVPLRPTEAHGGSSC